MVGAAVVFMLCQAAAGTGASATVVTPDALAEALRAAQGRQQGMDVAELAKQPGYSVLEGRRSVPGGAEVHADWADIWYVLRGQATLVTGGNVVEGATTQPGEIRGKGIVGGDERQLKGGEVVIIPSGVPHWISKVQGEIVYLVVKAPGGPKKTQ